MWIALLWVPARSLSVDDVAVGIWSGYECILNRVTAAAETWVRQFREVYVYSDFFPRNSASRLQALSLSTDMHLVSLGNCASHLIISTPWQGAQPRFLKAMVDLFAREPDKKWFIFLDDDSYLFLNTTLGIADQFNHSEKVVIGHFYCAWPQVVFGKNHTRQCLNFPQGGAGMVISHGMLSYMADKLVDCNANYNDREYAGSMRFGKCIDDHIRDGTWRHSEGIQNWKSQFLSRNPIEEIEDDFCVRPPATFHQVSVKKMKFVHRGHRSEWTTQNGTIYYVDWGHLTARPFPIFPEQNHKLHLRFGYAISIPDPEQVLVKASSGIEPQFDEFGKPIGYEQVFGPSLRIRLICDDSVERDVVEQDYVENREFLIFHLRVQCPPPLPYG
jgi:hypothetical protein